MWVVSAASIPVDIVHNMLNYHVVTDISIEDSSKYQMYEQVIFF